MPLCTDGNDDDYFDLGGYNRRVTTSSPDCQLWFDRGLVWIYGYNHEEAIACFERALKFDPHCSMAKWGIAYSIGPNYNKPWEEFPDDERRSVLNQAAALLGTIDEGGLSMVEATIINALRSRYPPPDSDDASTFLTTFDPFHDAYADAMRVACTRHADDLDVCSLTAEALMVRTPWKLWNLETGSPATGADTEEAVRLLERAFATLDGAWEHPGLLHMYVHLVEMSPNPERALRHGDALAGGLVPDAGHLVHMATHIDVLCGDYESVVSRNGTGIEADRKFLNRVGSDNFYTLYRMHNYHFKIYGALFLGQRSEALAAAEELIETLPEDLGSVADWIEAFIPMKQHVLVRFGMWQQILDQELPDDRGLYCVTAAMMIYARTIALANTDNVDAAEQECGIFLEAKRRVPHSRMLFNNTCRDILDVAEQMLLGEVAYRKRDHDVAFGHLRRAVDLDDHLPYDEPWGWMQPARHALGALLLEQGCYAEAEIVDREDLGLVSTLSRPCRHPYNVWSLHGMYECLQQRGEEVESIHIKQQLDKAMARSEVPIAASCFCRRLSTDARDLTPTRQHAQFTGSQAV